MIWTFLKMQCANADVFCFSSLFAEAITVEIEFRNPLQIPISVSGLSLICQSEEETTMTGIHIPKCLYLVYLNHVSYGSKCWLRQVMNLSVIPDFIWHLHCRMSWNSKSWKAVGIYSLDCFITIFFLLSVLLLLLLINWADGLML